MAKRTIILLGRRELLFEADVPDPHGNEPIAKQNERATRFLNQKYGVGRWRDPGPVTSPGRSSSHAIEAAEQTQDPKHGQLAWLRKHAANSLKKLDRIVRSSR